MNRTHFYARLGGLLVALGAFGSAGAAENHDSWDAVYLAGSKVGYIHTYIAPVKDKGRDLLRVRVDMVLSFMRQRDRITMGMNFGTIEDPDGTVLAMDTRINASNSEMRTEGRVVDGKMTRTLSRGGP